MAIPPRQIGLSGFGGLGDMFKWYCLQSAGMGWGYLQSLKEKYPHVRTMALICSTNPHAIDLFAHDPYIDTIEYYPWPLNKAGNLLQPGQLRLAQVLQKRGYPQMQIPQMQQLGLIARKCSVYLSDADQKELSHVTKGIGPYIVLHPFASVDERQVVNLEQYDQLIDAIIEQFNYDVVVLGKSYQRTFSDSQGKLTSYSKKETIRSTNPRVFNLVDKTNVRTAIKIVQGAAGFIGVHSCFSCIAAATRIPVVVLSTNINAPIVQKTMQNWWTKEPNVGIIKVNIQPWSETIDQTYSHLQKRLELT